MDSVHPPSNTVYGPNSRKERGESDVRLVLVLGAAIAMSTEAEDRASDTFRLKLDWFFSDTFLSFYFAVVEVASPFMWLFVL